MRRSLELGFLKIVDLGSVFLLHDARTKPKIHPTKPHSSGSMKTSYRTIRHDREEQISSLIRFNLGMWQKRKGRFHWVLKLAA